MAAFAYAEMSDRQLFAESSVAPVEYVPRSFNLWVYVVRKRRERQKINRLAEPGKD